jgi:hypothetical protein
MSEEDPVDQVVDETVSENFEVAEGGQQAEEVAEVVVDDSENQRTAEAEAVDELEGTSEADNHQDNTMKAENSQLEEPAFVSESATNLPSGARENGTPSNEAIAVTNSQDPGGQVAEADDHVAEDIQAATIDYVEASEVPEDVSVEHEQAEGSRVLARADSSVEPPGESPGSAPVYESIAHDSEVQQTNPESVSSSEAVENTAQVLSVNLSDDSLTIQSCQANDSVDSPSSLTDDVSSDVNSLEVQWGNAEVLAEQVIQVEIMLVTNRFWTSDACQPCCYVEMAFG